MAGVRDDDFYEDDEPIDKVRARCEAGEKGLTGPRRGWTKTLTFQLSTSTGEYFAGQQNEAVGTLVQH